QHEDYFGRDLAILNRCQITKTAPQLAPPLHTSAPYQREGVTPTYDLTYSVPNHDGSSVELGFEPGDLQLRGRHLNTRPPRSLDATEIPSFNNYVDLHFSYGNLAVKSHDGILCK
ncbi:hypothetical protein AVEN_127478-1, partial [Araneus ventricosus]